MLKSDVIWPNSRRFKSRTEWEPLGFFSEALCNSTQFDLKLGFFSSSAINVLADGFAAFLYNGGKMRMIIIIYIIRTQWFMHMIKGCWTAYIDLIRS